MEAVRFDIAEMIFFLEDFFFLIELVQVNNSASMSNCPGGGVQGRLN